MTTTRRLTVDAVLKMSTAAAQKHVDASPGDRKADADRSAAIAAIWELVKGRLGESPRGPSIQFERAQEA